MARRPLRAPAGDQEDDVNVTPLLDIVFIMLIFFIVTSTFIKEPGVEIERPLVKTQEELNPGILVAVTDDDQIFINGEQVELSEIRFFIRELRKETPKGEVVLQADTESRAKSLVDVINAIKDANIDSVAVSTEQS